MPIQIAPEPPDGRAALLRMLLALARAPSRGRPSLAAQRVARRRGLQISLPLPVYVVNSKRLSEVRQLAAARQLGWRYLLICGERLVATADVMLDRDSRSRVTGISTGPSCAVLAAALDRLDALPAKEAHGELRLLWSPRSCQRALWLCSARSNQVLVFEELPRPNRGGSK